MKGNYLLNTVKIICAGFVTGLFAFQASADSISLAWDASPSADVAGYTVYYGNESGNYSKQVDAGNETVLVLQGIDRRTNYFFAVTARSSDSIESLPSNEVSLSPESDLPQLAISAPTSSSTFVTLGSAINLEGTASDSSGIAQVTWSNECSGAFGSAAGTTSWSAANIPLCLGSNIFTITARDGAGNIRNSTITIIRNEPCTYTVAPSATIFSSGGGSGSASVISGSTCSWIATANVAWIKITSHATGSGNGVVTFSVEANNTCLPRSSVLTVGGKSFSLSQEAGAATIESVIGTFNGLFAGPLSQERKGLFSLKKAKQGFTGNIKLDGKQYAFSGKFDSAGRSSAVIKRSGKTSLNLQLNLEVCHSDKLSVAISDGGWSDQFSVEQSAFNSLKSPAPFSGRYTLAIAGLNSDTAVLNSDNLVSAETIPEGIGFATIKVSTAGLITITGNLGDGEPFSQSTFVSKNGEWPCYVPLYGKLGLISGPLTFQAENISPEGDLAWIKPMISKHRFYPLGFTNAVTAIGSPYYPPATATNRVLNFSKGSFVLDGSNPSGGLAKDVLLLPSSRILPVTVGEDSLNVTIRKDLGTFSGTIKLPGQKIAVRFKGGLLQNQNAGYGLFYRTNRSGQLLFEPSL